MTRTDTQPNTNGKGNGITVVTGGAGFIGANLAHRLLAQGERVLLLDNLSRPNVERNVEWLKRSFGSRCELRFGDVRDPRAVKAAVDAASTVYHFAAQVAVTTSLVDPISDFEVNARGTLNVLEAARCAKNPPLVVFTSTNKVYGGLPDVTMRDSGARWEPENRAIRDRGIGEDRPLDFHSPYGCSKGTADQYVHDWARSYGMSTIVFRMSCIYGPRQFGNEDQGWVAHFLIRALEGEPLTIYGDGKQVRDVLFVGDLVDAFLLARERRDALAGQAFNIGGGPGNAVSLMEILDRIGRLIGRRPELSFQEWRTGDQRWYVSDTRRFREATGWAPRVDVDEGVTRLHRWLRERLEPVEARAAAAGEASP
jgi:CDP-paratose 2-epimerase